MRNFIIIFLLILSFGLSAQNQDSGKNHRKMKYPNKSLQAHPEKIVSTKTIETQSETQAFLKLNMDRQKPGRDVVKQAKASSPKLLKSSDKNLSTVKKSNKGPASTKANIVQSTSKEAENVQNINPNVLKSTNNITIFDEDFNTWPLTGWTITSGTSSTATADGKWHEGFGSSGDTLNDFAAQVLYNNGLMSDEWLISPSISLTAGATLKMTFKWLGSYYWHVNPNDGADNPILISTNGGTTWQTAPLWQEDDSLQVIASGAPFPWTSFTWYTSEIDLSTYAGQTNVKIAFRYIGNDGAQWNIDNVEIFEETTCIDNLVTVGSPEIEPNGGLNETPVQYDTRLVGTLASPTLITGNYFTIGDSIRDMDWFNFTITQSMVITGTVDVVCTDPVIFILSNDTDAVGDFLYFFSADNNGAETGETLTTTNLPAGDYWFVVAPATFAGIPTPVNYNATLYGETASMLPGEECTNAIALTGSLPISGVGTGIENYSDDYSTVLTTPWGYSGGDVVYEFTPTTAGDVSFIFDCDFDNAIVIFTDCSDPASSQIDAMDNNFTAPFTETLTIAVTAGTTYYILNGAYEATATGDWDYTIESAIPCVDNLIPVGTLEIEPNGGLNETPVEYDPRTVGTPLMPTLITGNYFTVGDTVRDMDWFNFTLTQEMIITGTVDVVCTDPVIFIISNDTDALGDPVFFFAADANGAEAGETLTTTAMPAGDYWFVVAPAVFVGINTPVNYNATLAGEATGATQYLYFEDFQNGMPTDITLYDIDGLTPAANVASYTEAWNIIENFDLTGDSVAASNSWYSPAGTANDWLVTPGITVGTDAFLEWDIKAQDPSYADGYMVKISTTGTTTSSFTTTVYTIASASSTWGTISVNLDALGFTNTTIWVAFINNSTDMFLLLLDDIKVYVPNATDVAIQDAYFTPMADFSIIPLDQTGFTFGATAFNAGTAALSNITYE
ncbi:MAG: choice-of-anchor J domain-containing protein, partial [Bacteroidota bacterium]|nr:choice-of-anchor J domain-containing protein [Bacteroidota bacterium]